MKKILFPVCLLSVVLGCGKLGGGGGGGSSSSSSSSTNGVSIAQLLEKQSQQTIDFLRKDNDDYFKAINTLSDGAKADRVNLLTGLLDEVKKEISSLVADIKEHRALLLDASGNRNGAEDNGDFDSEGSPLSAHDKGGVRQYFFDDKNGEVLRDDIQKTKDALTEILNRFFNEYGVNPLGIHPIEVKVKKDIIQNMELLPTDSGKAASWTENLFGNKTLAEAAAVLTSLEFDAQLLSSSLLRQLCSDVLTGRIVRFDSFYPVIAPKTQCHSARRNI